MNDEVSREKKAFQELLEEYVALLSERGGEETLHSILRKLKELGFDRVRLYLLSANGKFLLPKAHIGMDGSFLQTPRPIENDYPIQVLLRDPRPHLFQQQKDIPSPFGCDQWICAPIVVQKKVIGKLSIDNLFSGRLLTEEDGARVATFAAQIATAVENSSLLSEATQNNVSLDQLMKRSSNAIITSDRKGRLTFVNNQAREMLGYSETDEFPQHVRGVYAKSDTPKKIGTLLTKQGGKIFNYETTLKNKNGNSITIRLSAIWLYNAHSQRIGVFGYFENLRSLRTIEERLQLVLGANTKVVSATNAIEALQQLAMLLVSYLQHSFCRILLAEENGQFLTVQAAFPIERSSRPLEWNPRLNERIAVSKIAGLAEILRAPTPSTVRLMNPHVHNNVERYSKHLDLVLPVRSLLLVPLRTQERLVGLLEIGELREEERAPISNEEKEIVSVIASQTVLLIDKLQRQAVNEHQRTLLEKLEDCSRSLAPEQGATALLLQAVRLAADFLEGTASAIYEYFSGTDSCQLRHSYGKFHELLESQPSLVAKLLKQVCQSGKAVIEHLEVGRSQEERPSDSLGTVIAVPLRAPRTGEVSHVLVVRYQPREYHFSEVDSEALQRFATRVALNLATAQAMSPEQRKLGVSPLLLKISDYMQSTGDEDKISHVLLTAITAGYGLGFNRAALFLMDERQHTLVGKLGIGHLSEADAQQDWEQGPRDRLEDMSRYLEVLDAGTRLETPLDRVIRGLRVELNDDEQNPFMRCIQDAVIVVVPEAELSRLPRRFSLAFNPTSGLVLAPVKAGGRVFGIVGADNKFLRHPIRPEDLDLLMTLTNTAAIAIANLHLLNETKTAKDRLHALYEASEAVLTTQDPEELIRNIVERLQNASGATWVSWVAIDEHGGLKKPVAAGGFQPFDVEKIRPNGITAEVLRTGHLVFIEDIDKARDRVNPLLFQEDVRALLCLPLSLQQTRIGVMWLHYEEPHHFTEEEIRDLQFYVNQVVVAYDIARRRDNLERVRRASEALAIASTLQEVEDAIERQAQAAFQAASVFVWNYDPRREQFFQAKSANPVTSETLRRQATEMEPEWRDSAQCILEQEWVSVHDVDDPGDDFRIPDKVRQWLHDAGIQSYQAVALQTEGEPLGVVYVNYNRPRRFTDEEQTLLRMFGTQASLAVRKAFLFEQLHNAYAAAQTVAEVSALGDLDTTLSTVTYGTLQALDCDAVTLYAYDQMTDTLSYPPKSAGLFHKERIHLDPQVANHSIIWTMLKRDERYLVKKIEDDLLFATTRFARDEQIKSCIALPLQAAGQKVGLMFVNYRHHHHFTDDELTRVQLYANQAAVAIHNAQLYEQAQKQTRSLQALHEAGQVITSSLDSAEVLRRIGKQAWSLIRDHGEQGGTANVWQFENEQLQLVAGFSSSEQGKSLEVIDLAPHVTTRIGIVGRTVRQNRPQRVVMNIDNDPDYIRANEATKSQLAVPITVDHKVIGVISIEDSHLNAFQEQDEQVLELLAAQASIAIQNARQYEDLEKMKSQLAAKTAVAWMGITSTTWRHATRIDAAIIRDLVQLAHQDLVNKEPHEKIHTRLGEIEDISKRILSLPIAASLSTESVQPVIITDLLRGKITQCRNNQLGGGTSDVEYQLELSSTLLHPVVRVDPLWFMQALDILIDNSLNAVTNVSIKRIKISIEVQERKVHILVNDTGIGIPQDIRLHLLQEPIKKKEGTKGTGMGLLIAQTIVQAYGGDISVRDNDQPGTTIVLSLPTEDGNAQGCQVNREHGNILLVSDASDPVWEDALAEVLRPFGTLKVTNQETIQQQNAQDRYKLIIAEETPTEDFIFLIRHLRSQHPNTKIIVVATIPDWRIAREIFRAGASDYMPKSMYFEELRVTLNRVFEANPGPNDFVGDAREVECLDVF